jgi:hypothetical protein
MITSEKFDRLTKLRKWNDASNFLLSTPELIIEYLELEVWMNITVEKTELCRLFKGSGINTRMLGI